MCNCIKEVEGQIKEIFLKRDNVESVSDAELQNTAFLLGKIGSTQLFSPCVVEYYYKNKKKEIKHKKEKVNISYKFCPICGEPYEK